VEYLLEKQGRRPARVEGYDSGGWVLLDYENVIVHVFQTSTRDFYSLERLWADAKAVDTKFLSEEV
ncbi:MAG: ribosome silencing factor, partial [Oscillospiraceae bacterium]